jgi:uncharacterized membrane protein HdeD (DUF308 family)
MNKSFKILGICIALSSILSLMDPMAWFFQLPVVFGLGCIVYGLGIIMERLQEP